MSEITPGSATSPQGTGSGGTVETAKGEASGIASTAGDEAGRVVDTAKSEAKNVAQEAKSQARDLYHQSQRELREQAGQQQQRVASGLRALADELGSMADGSDQQGVGSDLVRQVSAKADEIGSWLGDRDPGSLLTEVKSFARRKPGVFIGVAALAGLAAGRLTRALAQGAPDSGESGAASSSSASTAEPASAPPQPAATTRPDASITGAVPPPAVPPVGGGTPVYDQTTTGGGDPFAGRSGDDRPHTV
ncbi:hypothetical protein AB3M83_07710 [Microbacterium sp. 179-B 1A2 NHS]|uniref:hypothetical protein n=1 Tax=Microbacterium sp. 179-B 1A2 NHS TaxID=3142383 RepID=UPI0039A36D3E